MTKAKKKKGLTDSWCSPPEIAVPLEAFFEGPVDVDPCSNDRSIIRSRLAFEVGGLILPWRVKDPRARGTCYQNDPYSKADLWTTKMLAEIACGNVQEIIRLSMFACSTRWWADMCYKPARNPRILALRRLSFLDPEAAERGMTRLTCRFEPALTYIGPRPERFDRIFAHLTRWSAWGRS